MIRRPPRSTLFPYTTLFRSRFFLDVSIVEFLTSRRWNPPGGEFGILPLVYGTLMATFIALAVARSEEHTSELQSRQYLVCRLLLEKKNNYKHMTTTEKIYIS